MNCIFQLTESTTHDGKQEYICKACGRTHWSKYGPEKIHRNCTNGEKVDPTWPCIYRGRELDRRECPSCKGTVQVKVLACTLFECCQVQNYLPGVKACSLCDKRETIASETSGRVE